MKRLLRMGVAGLVAVAALAASGADASTDVQPSIGQMVGQLMFVPMHGTVPSKYFLARIRSGQIGGVILYSTNFGPAGPAALIRQLQQTALQAGRPRLLIGIDQEGGIVKRLPGAPRLSAQQMTTTSVARAQGTATARNLRSYGIEVDFAPVMDIGHGGFITSRTFGSTPSQVALRATAFARGLSLGGVAATGKHFPGLGYAWTNTDKTQTIVRATAAQLNADLLPYRKAIAAGLPMVMISTAAYPSLGVNVPAACSSAVVTGLLRRQLGFDGVVVTDALDTADVGAYWPTPQAAVKSIAAGVDMVLAGGGTGRAKNDTSIASYNALVNAAQTGALPRRTVAAAYARVLALKRTLSY